MFNSIRVLYSKRLLRQQIAIAVRTIYSEQFDFDAMVSRLCPDRQLTRLLRAYVAIQAASRLAEPLSDAIVDQAYGMLSASEAHQDSAAFGDIIDVHRELAEIGWLERRRLILKGTVAHQENEYSYRGTIYALEAARKGPVSAEERAKASELSGRMADLDRRIENRELEVLRDSDKTAYEERKDEVEVRQLRDEVDTNEEEELDSELQDVVSMLERKLSMLLKQST